MNATVPNFSNTKILVVGDVMLDRYWHGSTQRISPEAPVPVVQVQQMEERPGGAGNVALNLAALGAQVVLIGVCGDDNNGNILESKLKAAKVTCSFIRLKDKPTTTKLRILSLHQQLIRLDFEDNFHEQGNSALIERYLQYIDQASAVILSDYGKGTLAQCQELIKIAQQKNIPTFVDPKGRDFSIYRGATFLTPNKKEFEEVVGVCRTESEFIEKGHKLMEQCQFGNLLITRGAQGMTLLTPGNSEFHLPAIAREVYDVTGAGDTVISVLGLAIASHCEAQVATILANRAAGIVVGKLGAATVSAPELRRALQDQIGASGVMTKEQLLFAVAEAKDNGEKIVMTNGCFDILHAGHVSYLENAKSLGAKLIVAVNDDASVAKLKGNDRPINTLERRMAVLAGLSSVDWVVPFSEDTPEQLINEVLPDVLVKGGDYRVEQIAGHQSVLANGGKVEILNFVPGCSTSAIVEKIKEGEIA